MPDKTPMPLPDVTDYARINPPWASIVVGRSPVVRWHDTHNGALRAASYNSWGDDPDPTKAPERYGRWDTLCTQTHGIAHLAADGSLVVTESWTQGEVRS